MTKREIKVRCAACGHLTRIPTVTNADRIRAMTDEELIIFFWSYVDGSGKTVEQWMEWLKQEAE